MKTKLLRYNIIIEKEQQPNGSFLFVTHVPTLNISDFGKTPDQAAKNTEEAIKIYIKTLQELGEEVPRPDSEEVYVTSRNIKVEVSNLTFAS